MSGSCKAGHFCPLKSSSATQQPCQPGHYCVEESPSQEPCQDGMYMTDTGATQCMECPQSKMCGGTGTITPAPCPKGQYCTKVRSISE